jgi:hypothetical protein
MSISEHQGRLYSKEIWGRETLNLEIHAFLSYKPASNL